ncbi:MAG TPA: RNA methyltransferase [Phycisphaerae bacterium]|nr:RNA methyltransferase [Phycisphaerae bacterium]
MKSDEVITSPQNPRIKAVARLRDHRTHDARDQIVIDGRRELARALEAGVAIGEIFYCPALLGADDSQALLEPAQERGARLVEVNEAVFAKLSYGDRAEGAVAVAQRPARKLADLRLSRTALLAVVEGIEKPGNLGAILRSADGAGVEAVIAADPVTDIYGANVIRSSLGTAFSVPLVEATTAETIEWLDEHRLSIVAASPVGKTPYTDVAMAGPTALVLGSEADGLTPAWSKAGVIQAAVPMLGKADSLNVSITAALFFYEALRQRRAGKQ